MPETRRLSHLAGCTSEVRFDPSRAGTRMDGSLPGVAAISSSDASFNAMLSACRGRMGGQRAPHSLLVYPSSVRTLTHWMRAPQQR